ncbi:MAG TPA: 3-isopropylmalate dehydratase small subunit, partial [Anaerolineae bacterium]|nr:3-isopropylmalate dehydratase small subunit [Anaerolineae bacterium]
IPARYLLTSDAAELAQHCMEDLDPQFAQKVQPGDFILAGENFGSGSSREHAPLAIKGTGVACVIAKSFARIFYRNAFNIGLPILESTEAVDGSEQGHELEVDLESGCIHNLTTGDVFQAQPIPDFMMGILGAGGLIEYTKQRIRESANQ